MNTSSQLQPLSDKRVLVLGLGDSGVAMARWCLSQGAHVHVVDTRAHPPGLARLELLCSSSARLSFGSRSFGADLIEGEAVDALFKSPGLSPQQVAPVWQAAQQRGLWMGTELTLFAHALQHLHQQQGYSPRVLAVTGTNGKTTVTALSALLLRHAGKTAIAAGNIGLPMLDALSDALHAHTLPQVWVLELSSFQLDGVVDFHPTAATVLNVTQDHLDWHGSMQHYAAAKENIYGAGAGQCSGPIGALYKRHTAIVVRDALPRAVGEYGIEEVAHTPWLVRAVPQEYTLQEWQAAQDTQFAQELQRLQKSMPLRSSRRSKAQALQTEAGSDAVAVLSEPYIVQRLLPASALRIVGMHNYTNALAALALATRAGCALAPMLHGLRTYRGEPHRLQKVALINAVQYIDDSKGTNVGATLAALSSLDDGKGRLLVILGGDGKGQDFAPLCAALARHAKAVALIGKDAQRLEAAIADHPQCHALARHRADSLESAVRYCAGRAVAGDTVLLSPACASMDMFTDYTHRAAVFVAAVNALAQEAGVQHGAHVDGSFV